MPQQPLNVVILGGSFSGLAVANTFIDKITDLSTFDGAHTYRVILVNPSSHVYWNTFTPQALVPINSISPEEICVPIEPRFKQHSSQLFTFVQGLATDIDTSTKKVHVKLTACQASSSTPSKRGVGYRSSITRTKTIPYHALVLATGTSAHSPLFSLHGPHEDTLAEISAFHQVLEHAHSVTVVGGGSAGVETAGRLASYYNRRGFYKKSPDLGQATSTTDTKAALRAYTQVFGSLDSKDKQKQIIVNSAAIVPRERQVQGEKHDSAISRETDATTRTILQTKKLTPKTITLISGGVRLLPKLSPKLSHKAERQLRNSGVRIIHDARQIGHTRNADGSSNCILNNEMTITSDMLIEATGVYPNTRFLPSHMLDKDEYIITDTRTLRVHGRNVGERVYAIGDCANYARERNLDVCDAVPVLVTNMYNDILTHEYKLQTVTSSPTSVPSSTPNRSHTPNDPASPSTPQSYHKSGITSDLFNKAVLTALPESPAPAPPETPQTDRSLLPPSDDSPRLHLPIISPIRTSFIWTGLTSFLPQPKRISQTLQQANPTAAIIPSSPSPSSPTKPHTPTAQFSFNLSPPPPLPSAPLPPPPPPPPSLPLSPSKSPSEPLTLTHDTPVRRRPLLTASSARAKIEALEDAHYTPTPQQTVLIPITRYSGVGIINGHCVPSCLVNFLKAREWRGAKKRGG